VIHGVEEKVVELLHLLPQVGQVKSAQEVAQLRGEAKAQEEKTLLAGQLAKTMQRGLQLVHLAVEEISSGQ